MANAAVPPEVSPGFRTSITRSLFSARHDLDGDRTRNMMPLMRIADYHDG
jgi:hypothetical protein